jgi:hypothetical protein
VWVKTPLLPLPSTAATVDDTAIGAVGSIPLPPSLTKTAITAFNNHHCRCHTVNNDDHQMPKVVVHHWRQQWQCAATQLTVNGSGDLSR